MGWPQIIVLVLSAMSLGVHCAKDGLPRGNYSASVAVLEFAALMLLLWWGGFFS